MKTILLTLAFLALPLAAVSVTALPSYAAATTTELGDLSPLATIATDTLAAITSGDMATAAARVTAFESAWDADASRLRALSNDKWGVIDDATDRAIAAVRRSNPVTADAGAAVTALIAALNDPSAPAPHVGAATAVSDANGRPLPCEDLLAEVRTRLAAAPPAAADKGKIDELQSKGIERCNADDDKRADGFFAQALALMNN